ncbi:hypothetical protein [Pseudolysinimonas sp.]|jgi:hypothetical protein|uniref:hypothetical protein n=1 Tax=Pseudolysinimonas sp. TaxID=2680009 RepID=UPI003783065C
MEPKEHPSPQLKVQHFLATVDDYERLERTFPMPTQINIFGHREDEESRWAAVLHGALLRKYFAPNDRLELSRVVTALRSCVVTEDLPEQEWAEIVENVGKYETTTRYGEEAYSETDILIHYLHGRYLHGDYGKWASTLAHRPAIPDGAFWSATHSRARRVLTLAEWIRGGIDAGTVLL